MTLSLIGWTRRPLAGLAASLVLAGSLSGCVINLAPMHEETRSLDADYIDGMGIEVESNNGSISVTQEGTEAVYITARIRASSEDRLAATRIIAERDPVGDLVIRALWPDGKRHSREGCSFEIVTPGAYGVRLRTGNGAITIQGLKGSADLSTSNGRIVVIDHDGDVYADTSNGRVELAGVSGAVDVDTSNGRVTVALTPDNEGPVSIDTSNGSVTLNLGPAFRGELELETGNGSISYETPPTIRRVDSSKHRATLLVGEGGQRSVVDTGNGSIRIEFHEDGD